MALLYWGVDSGNFVMMGKPPLITKYQTLPFLILVHRSSCSNNCREIQRLQDLDRSVNQFQVSTYVCQQVILSREYFRFHTRCSHKCYCKWQLLLPVANSGMIWDLGNCVSLGKKNGVIHRR